MSHNLVNHILNTDPKTITARQLSEWANAIEALRAANARLLDCYKGSTYTVDVLIKDNAKLREALKQIYDAVDFPEDTLRRKIRAARAAMGENDAS